MVLRFKIIDKDKRILQSSVGIKGGYTEEMRVQISDSVDIAILEEWSGY